MWKYYSETTQVEQYLKILPQQVTCSFLELTLMKSSISKLKNEQQKKGCAVGITTPSYENIFMNHFKNKSIYSFIKWLSSIRSIHQLCLNPKRKVTFLDTELYIKNNKLYIKTYKNLHSWISIFKTPYITKRQYYYIKPSFMN